MVQRISLTLPSRLVENERHDCALCWVRMTVKVYLVCTRRNVFFVIKFSLACDSVSLNKQGNTSSCQQTVLVSIYYD